MGLNPPIIIEDDDNPYTITGNSPGMGTVYSPDGNRSAQAINTQQAITNAGQLNSVVSYANWGINRSDRSILYVPRFTGLNFTFSRWEITEPNPYFDGL